MDMITKYVVILAAIPAVAGFIGRAVFGYNVLGMHSRVAMGPGFVWAVMYYVMSIVGVIVFALIIDLLAPSFGAKKDFNGSMKVAVFSMTASWVAGVFALFPALAVLSLLGLYSLYLLWLGMKAIKEPPADKQVVYYVISLVVGIVVYIVVGAVVGIVALGGAMMG
jgi:hypothetical protein